MSLLRPELYPLLIALAELGTLLPHQQKRSCLVTSRCDTFLAVTL